ncbi:cathepsin L1-like [Acanthaster planci]|uniref:Cathepsin L1-like n=1 Tax=Acanthaster planci TaxID=133434 RepID=A0A8B7ZJQ4_ACAPL|nr:cathepsin L1-like [Acanthaster planci]
MFASTRILQTAFVLFVVCLSLGFLRATSDEVGKAGCGLHWEEWKEAHEKKYDSLTEEVDKRQVWEKNIVVVREHNSKTGRSFDLAMNKFGDQTHAEMISQMKYPVDPIQIPITPLLNGIAEPPSSVDWRTKGYVTPVRNQGACGGSVAYAAADTVASREAIHEAKPARVLSAQEINDCCAITHRACLPPIVLDKVFDCIHSIGGLCMADSYHKSKNFTCNNGTCSPFAKVPNGGVQVATGDEKALAAAVAIEPILVGLDANHTSFFMYRSGIYSEPNCKTKEPNHAMVLVGYGSQNGQDYWICKNSWGADWGMQGYILMARNHGNMCGIASNATYPM